MDITTTTPKSITSTRILGIDPGSQVVGYALITNKREIPLNPKDFRILDAGALRTKHQLSYARKIGYLHETLYDLAKDLRPDICIIEKSFVGINPNSSIRLGEARGSLISAIHRLGVQVEEVTPTQVKKTITGRGHATKQEVACCLKALLNFDLGTLPFDVSDALAIALYYGMTYSSARILGERERILTK